MKLKITIDTKVYEVEVEASEPEQVQMRPMAYLMQPAAVRVPATPQAAAPVDDGGPVNEEKVCRSPISGIVAKLTAQEGQSIQPGDTILVLEAMKMETNITAPMAGKIAKIRVNPGDSVKAGVVLVEFE